MTYRMIIINQLIKCFSNPPQLAFHTPCERLAVVACEGSLLCQWYNI